jgi:hypothetical protein
LMSYLTVQPWDDFESLVVSCMFMFMYAAKKSRAIASATDS